MSERDPPEDDSAEQTTQPLTLKDSFGTALGSAMLGFEQALRDGPPAEVQAAEHMPQAGGSGQGSDLVIEFPHPVGEDDPDDGER